MDVPFWMYLVVMGIVFSAFMVYKTGKEEKQIEDEIIEREGEVYMKRLEQEREEKQSVEKSMGV
ncbi:sporulation YhaL family protein [Niallia sp. XMNu-256]|uniref:sporulation YhaL family protein n=1 Tax=Niallia sp. XMNu-256 TaxID=3082444 RepID=UPI0030CABCEE